MTTAPTARKTDSPIWTIVVGLAVLAGLVAATIGALSLAEALLATGLPNPGPVTSYGLPFVRAARKSPP